MAKDSYINEKGALVFLSQKGDGERVKKFFEENINDLESTIIMVKPGESVPKAYHFRGSQLSSVEEIICAERWDDLIEIPGFTINASQNSKPQFYMREKGSVDELFRELINIRGVNTQLGMNESTVRALRKKCNDGTPISVEKKREILEAAGYSMIQEERWGK